jgi:hypothetical protein
MTVTQWRLPVVPAQDVTVLLGGKRVLRTGAAGGGERVVVVDDSRVAGYDD